MGFFDSISPRALGISALLLGSLAQDVFARPAPDVRRKGGPGKKKVSDHIKRALDHARRTTELPSCVETLANAIKAPKPNPFAPLTDVETAGVVEWLFEQKDLNLTTSDEAGSWDNTMSVPLNSLMCNTPSC